MNFSNSCVSMFYLDYCSLLLLPRKGSTVFGAWLVTWSCRNLDCAVKSLGVLKVPARPGGCYNLLPVTSLKQLDWGC